MVFPRGDQYVGRSLEVLGEYSKHEVEFFLAVLSAGDVVVEAGANIGAHTVPIARKVGPQGKVYAFEPQRHLFAVLCTNICLNGLENVVPEWAAVGAEPGQTAIPMPSLASRANFGGIGLGTGEPVRMVTIDSLNLTALRLLKADVEGFERHVIEGAAETIRRCKPVLFVENDRRALSPDLIRAIRAHGYRLWWHHTPLYTPDNFRGAANPFDKNYFSINMIGLPEDSRIQLQGMHEVGEPEAWPFG